MNKKKKGFVPYDYEAAFNKSVKDMHEWFIEQILKNKSKVVYALKEIKAGEQFEVEIYPQFSSKKDVPAEGLKKDNSKAQKKLNDENARKYVERLINHNFFDKDIWITLTYDEKHIPDNMETAIKNMQNYMKRINYERKKRSLENCKYVYITEYDPGDEIRWHHHIVMDGDMDMDTVEKLWKKGSRNEVRRLVKDENGLSGMANYLVKKTNRKKSEKRWNSSKNNLKKPPERVVRSKRPDGKKSNYKKIESYIDGMVKNQDSIKEQMKKWYPDYDFTNANVYLNDFNNMFYIHVRLRKGRALKNDKQTESEEIYV